MAAGKRRANAGSFKPGQSGNPSGRPKRLDWRENLSGVLRGDGWYNDLTGQGVIGRDKLLGSGTTPLMFGADVVDAVTARELWRGDDMAARIVETPPSEALREGWTITIGEDDAPERFTPPEAPDPVMAPMPGAAGVTPQRRTTKDGRTRYGRWSRMDAATRSDRVADTGKKLQQAVEKQLVDLGAIGALREAMNYERAYGGGALLLGANDYTVDMREPLDLANVQSLDWITPLEPRELVPLYWYTNPRAPKFGQPAIYRLVPMITGAAIERDYVPQMMEVHESRLIIFPGARVTRQVIGSATYGWGDSVFTRVGRALRNFNIGFDSTALLLTDFAQTIYRIKGLAELIAQDGDGALVKKMQSIDLVRSILRAAVVDADGEDVERKSTSLAGLPEVLDRLSTRLAAAADMPQTLLMGQSPAGLNATGASDIRFFYDRIAGIQRWRVAPAVLRLIEIILITLGENPAAINHCVEFPSLWQPTDKEIAERNLTQAQADQIYISNGVVSPEEIAVSRFGAEKYSLDTHVDFEARAAMEALSAPPVDTDPTPDPQPTPPAVETGPMPDDADEPTGAAPSGPEQ